MGQLTGRYQVLQIGQSEVITATAIGANDAPTIRDWQAFTQDLYIVAILAA